MSRWRRSPGRRRAVLAAAALVCALSLLVLGWHLFGGDRPLGNVPAAALPRVLGALAFLVGGVALGLGALGRRRAAAAFALTQAGLALLGIAWPHATGGETQDVMVFAEPDGAGIRTGLALCLVALAAALWLGVARGGLVWRSMVTGICAGLSSGLLLLGLLYRREPAATPQPGFVVDLPLVGLIQVVVSAVGIVLLVGLPTSREGLRVALRFGSVLAVAVVLFGFMRREEKDGATAEFRVRAHEVANHVDLVMRTEAEALMSLRAFFDAASQPEPEQFDRFTAAILRAHPELVALDWAPRTSSDGGTERYPIRYSAVREGAPARVGLDPGVAGRDRVLRVARDTAAKVTSLRTASELPGDPPASIVLVRAVYSTVPPPDSPTARRDAVRGFLVETVDPGAVLAQASAGTRWEHLEMYLREEDGPAALHARSDAAGRAEVVPRGRADSVEAIWGAVDLSPPGASWRLVVAPEPGFFSGYRRFTPWVVLVAGAFVAFLLTVWLGAADRAARVGRIAQRRSEDLAVAQAGLREREEKYRTLFVESPVGKWELDLRRLRERLRALDAETADLPARVACDPALAVELLGLVDVVAVNRAALEVHGAARAEELLDDLPAVLAPDPPRAVGAVVAVLLRGEARLDARVPLRTVQGSTRWVFLRLAAVGAEPEPFSRVLITTLDVTAERRALESLREQEARTRQVLETVPQAVVTADAFGTILSANPACERLFGWPPADLVGRNVMVLSPPRLRAQQERGMRLFRETRVRRMPRGGVEVRARRRDGTTFPALVDVGVSLTEGAPVLTAVISDLSAMKAAQADLERRARELAHANEELERFAYVASHDLQEPLRTISGFTQLLMERYKGRLDADADEFIAFIVDGASRMQRMIRDLLAHARLGYAQMQVSEVDPGAVVQDALRNLHGAIGEAKAEVRVGRMPPVNADRTQLSQVFQNLIGNSLKFRAQRRPRVHVGASRRNGEVVFWVADNGQGFEMGHASRLFQVFQRLHGPEYTGTGIGLANCKRIVVRHGGRIWCRSKPGRGSTFVFTIPAARVQEEEDDGPA